MKVNRALWHRNRRSTESGYVLVMVTICLLLLLGFAGLATDVSYLEHVKRRMQTAADAGAIAGAQELVRNGTSAPMTVIRPAAVGDAAVDGFPEVENTIITVNHPPATGLYAGDMGAVEVIITQSNQPIFFMVAMSAAPASVTARAVAHLGAGDGCMFILNDNPALTGGVPPLTINGTSRMDLPDCAVQVNSPLDPAVKCDGSVDLNLDLNVVGGARCSQASSVSEGALPAPDPLASVPEPKPVPPCTYNTTVNLPDPTRFPPDAAGWVHLNQGVYCGGINLNNGAKVFFNGSDTPYYINNGGFTMSNGATATGTGVTFYITGTLGAGYQPIKITGGNFGCQASFTGCTSPYADTIFTAPSSGNYKGILFFGDRTIQPAVNSPDYDNIFYGVVNAAFNGVLYFKTGKLELGGTGDMSATNTAIVVDQAFIHGNPSFTGDLGALPGGPVYTKAVLGE